MANESLAIYSMNKVERFAPPNKQILRDISIGFHYGVKIGVALLLILVEIWTKEQR